MELFGILFSIPLIFVTSIIYAFIIRKVTEKFGFLTKPLLWVSAVLLATVLLEFVGVATVGSIKLRESIGPSFHSIHIALFSLAVPALVNIMRLQKRYPLLSRWYIIGFFCALCGLCIVLLQYVVSETLFGIDEMGGPYGKP
jgi:hypothetical protein